MIKDVTLAANTRILGGRLSGKISGDKERPGSLIKRHFNQRNGIKQCYLEKV
ncbi:MAG: hypothetical protein R3E08_07745 [Thiotrichaceae bacterium]